MAILTGSERAHNALKRGQGSMNYWWTSKWEWRRQGKLQASRLGRRM